MMKKHLTVIARDQCIGCLSCMFACSRTWHEALTTSKAALKVRSYTGSEGNFSIRICKACLEPECVAACPTGALSQKENGALQLEAKECVSCKICVESCLIGGLAWDEEFSRPLPCFQCGACVRYCPNQVIAMTREETDNVD